MSTLHLAISASNSANINQKATDWEERYSEIFQIAF